VSELVVSEAVELLREYKNWHVLKNASVWCSGEGATGITFNSIHGTDGKVIKAADLKLARFLSEADQKAAAAAAPASELPKDLEVVLLTGANGFLGRFLLLDLLQRVSKKCVCPSHERYCSRAFLCLLSGVKA
jgi:hypothetical protein